MTARHLFSQMHPLDLKLLVRLSAKAPRRVSRLDLHFLTTDPVWDDLVEIKRARSCSCWDGCSWCEPWKVRLSPLGLEAKRCYRAKNVREEYVTEEGARP